MYGKKTLYEYLVEYVRQEPDKKILGWHGGWLTNTDVLERVESCAWELKHRGVKRGDYVALRSSRSPQSVIAILALQTLGAVAVMADPYKKVRDFLADSGVDIPVSFILTNEDTAKGVWDGDDTVLTNCATGKEAPMDPLTLPSHACPEENGDPWAPGFVIFTSGSTGKSKAVVQCQANYESAAGVGVGLTEYGPDDIALGVLPLEHVFGLVLTCAVIVLKHALYLVKESGLKQVLSDIQRVGITRMSGNPQLYLAMCMMKDKFDLSTLRAGLIGGSPFTPEQLCKIEKDLGMTICPVYGMSECIVIATGDHKEPLAVRSISTGRFCWFNTGKILLDDGTEADPYQEGEICVDGLPRMLFYYGDPESAKGMLHTGDLGFMDDRGCLHISGRKKDIIIRNGKNLSPRRIEEAILAVPGVKDCCVVGVPDEKNGEVPCAMVVGTADQETIMEHLRNALAKNELPQGILQVDAMPLLGSGKPDKQKVREVLIQWKKS